MRAAQTQCPTNTSFKTAAAAPPSRETQRAAIGFDRAAVVQRGRNRGGPIASALAEGAAVGKGRASSQVHGVTSVKAGLEHTGVIQRRSLPAADVASSPDRRPSRSHRATLQGVAVSAYGRLPIGAENSISTENSPAP